MRAELPTQWIERVRAIMSALPECQEERAWTGLRWTVRGQNVAHLFGGEDGLVRLTFRTEMSEVPAFEQGAPRTFRVGGSGTVVGVLLDDETDPQELREVLEDSWCVQAPRELVRRLRPEG